jgi:hypothetical protein
LLAKPDPVQKPDVIRIMPALKGQQAEPGSNFPPLSALHTAYWSRAWHLGMQRELETDPPLLQ